MKNLKMLTMSWDECLEARNNELKKFWKGKYYEIPSIDGGSFIVWSGWKNNGSFDVVEMSDGRRICVSKVNTLYQSSRRAIYEEILVKFILAHPHKFSKFFEEKAEERHDAGPCVYWGDILEKCA